MTMELNQFTILISCLWGKKYLKIELMIGSLVP